MQEKTLEEWPNIHPLLQKHMDNQEFSDDQIGEINEMLKKAREEGRKEGYWEGVNVMNDEYNKELTQYKEELLGKLPKEKEFTLNDDSVFPIFAEGFNECLSEVKKIII
jgi:hypothetical protein